MKLKGVLVATMLLVPAAAMAAPGMVTTSVSMRAGPGTGFPMVNSIPGGAEVDIHGCLRGDAWCDVSWSGDRGWVSSEYLEYLYRDRYVYLPDYFNTIDVPIVPFVLSSYWGSYYSGRPWYRRRAHWTDYWNSHARLATRLNVDPSAARIGRQATLAANAQGRMRPGIERGATRAQGLANTRAAQAAQGRAARVNGANRPTANRPMSRAMPRAVSRAPQQPMVRGRQATRFSAAPAARPAPRVHVAQPVSRRVARPPMAARAQMAAPRMTAPRAAPAMSHAAAPHISAAPRAAGGGGGGGRGHRH